MNRWRRFGFWPKLFYYAARGLSSRRPTGGEKVNEIKTRTEESSNNQILFPMAVGVLFLAMLVAGALLG